MKTQVKYVALLLTFLLTGWKTAAAQGNDWEVPGDNFSLEGALELFKKSSSPEEFERQLNQPDSKVNNLDLNGDGYVDYIKVVDRNEGSVHTFVLRAMIAEREEQDVAVIELEKFANGKAVLQITGDEDIYGIETIIEPTEEVRINAGTTVQTRIVNVWTWPAVQYVYSPYYVGWISPWRWSNRPFWWSTWRPVAYVNYYPYWQPYRSSYTFCYTHRIGYAYDLYRPYRTTSVVVYKRHHDRIAQYRSKNGQDHERNAYDNRRDNRQHGDVSRNDSERDRRTSASPSRSEATDASSRGKSEMYKRPVASRDDFSAYNRSGSTIAPSTAAYPTRGSQQKSVELKSLNGNNKGTAQQWTDDRKVYHSTPAKKEYAPIIRSRPQVNSAPRVVQKNNSHVQKSYTPNSSNSMQRPQTTRPASITMQGSSAHQSAPQRPNSGNGKSVSKTKKGRN